MRAVRGLANIASPIRLESRHVSGNTNKSFNLKDKICGIVAPLYQAKISSYQAAS